MNVRKRAAVAVAGVIVLAAAPAAGAHGFGAATAPRNLTTEHAGDGVQVDVAQPRLSWQDTGDGQGAYEIAFGDGRHTTWDSGKMASADETDIAYGGPALQSDATYSWSVRVWDASGRPSAWSRPATFDTALLKPSDWSAQ